MFWWRVAFFAYAAFASFLLLAPHPLQLLGLAKYSASLSAGRGQHVVIFLGLTLCALWSQWSVQRVTLVAVLVGYAAATEALQAFIPPRQSDWGDLAENLMGLAVGLAVHAAASRLTGSKAAKPISGFPSQDD